MDNKQVFTFIHDCDNILSLESLLNDPDYHFFHNVIKDRISQILRDKGARAYRAYFE